MAKDSPILSALFIVATVLFLFAMGHLFVLYNESADIYPPYSSLRSDPLGTRVFYEGLATVAEGSQSRYFETLDKLPEGRDTTLFLFGAAASRDPRPLVERVEQFVGEGGRIVIAFYPVVSASHKDEKPPSDQAKPPSVKETPSPEGAPLPEAPPSPEGPPSGEEPGTKEETAPTPEAQPAIPPHEDAPAAKTPRDKKEDPKKKAERPGAEENDSVLIDERWGFRTAYTALPGKEAATAKRHAALATLPETLPWHSSAYFADLTSPWEIVYAIDERAVVIQRKWGNGAIVLCSDSYLTSNEAMVRDRHPNFLAWLAGSSKRVLFDESHFGLVEQSTFLSLMHRYHMTGILIALLLVVVVAAWWSVSSLLPKRTDAEEAEAQYVGGRDDITALVNLLQRSVTPREVVAVCLAEWKRDFQHEGGVEDPLREKLKRVQAIVDRADREKGRMTLGRREPAGQSPDALYREICGILAERSYPQGQQTGKEQ